MCYNAYVIISNEKNTPIYGKTSKFREFMSPAIIVYYLNEIMTKTSVKFQKNRHKTVGGVAHTRYPVSINFDSKNARKMPKLK